MTQQPVSLGPVELVVLSFPGNQIDGAVGRAFADVIANECATVVDLIYLAKDAKGAVDQIEIDDSLAGTGLEGISVESLGLVNDDDLEVIRSSMEPDTAAVVLVYEQTWARELAREVRGAGGEVSLHVQVPRDAIDAALSVPSES
ncbi:DUF6325 family protein [Dietzia sp. NPDC055877]